MSRRYVAEFIGAFAIVFLGCGSVATVGTAPSAGIAISLVFGLTVAVMIYALGHISAAHFNPAVTIGFALSKKFPWRYVPSYIAAQCLGAVGASALHLVLLNNQAKVVNFGATMPAIGMGASLGMEIALTFFLMFVIMSIATDKRANEAIAGIAIGGTVALCALFGGPLTGASMNPARSIGPALFAGQPAMGSLWLYLLGPVVGAAIAAMLYELVRGGDEHSQGAPNDLAVALHKVSQEAQHEDSTHGEERVKLNV